MMYIRVGKNAGKHCFEERIGKRIKITETVGGVEDDL